MRADIETRAGGLSRLRAAVVRFLGKLVFFAGMTGIGFAGGYYVPSPADPNHGPLSWVDVALIVPMFVFVLMALCGQVGLVVTLFTAGRKPRWH